MDKREKSPSKVKTQSVDPTLNKQGWPAQAPNAGIKRANFAHSRKPVNRGSGRGR